MNIYFGTFFAVLLIGCSVQVWAHDKNNTITTVNAEVYQTAAGQVVQLFHQALQQGDREAVLAQLAPEVQIFEGAGVERSAPVISARVAGRCAPALPGSAPCLWW